jgi:hypothetical protein
MNRWLMAAVAIFALAGFANAAGLTGQYIEARTCDIWTAPCFANAEMNLAGKHALLGWKVNEGTLNNVSLKGLSVVAVIAATDTLGLEQTGTGKAVLIVDARATDSQRDALIALARRQGGSLVANVIGVQRAPIDLETCTCKGGTCAKLEAGRTARIETRCIDNQHDKACGNEKAFYPPLAQDVTAKPAVAVENRFTGNGFNATWKEAERRGAYVGSFAIR